MAKADPAIKVSELVLSCGRAHGYEDTPKKTFFKPDGKHLLLYPKSVILAFGKQHAGQPSQGKLSDVSTRQ